MKIRDVDFDKKKYKVSKGKGKDKVEYKLGDVVLYAKGGIYDIDKKIVPNAKKVKIIALDLNEKEEYCILLGLKTEYGTPICALGGCYSIIEVDWGIEDARFNTWANFNEITKYTEDYNNGN